MKLGCTYIKVKEMEKSTKFYSTLLGIEPTYQISDRWVSFNCGNIIALYNNKYDLDMLPRFDNVQEHYNDAYIEYFKNEKHGNGSVVLNFSVDNLRFEYNKLKELNIGTMSEIMFVNISFPYWFFIIEDPDGNEIEIEGKYNE